MIPEPILLAPGQDIWPPLSGVLDASPLVNMLCLAALTYLRIANWHSGTETSAFMTVDTSFVDRGCTIVQGRSRGLHDQ